MDARTARDLGWIKCGNCHQYHQNKQAVFECCRGAANARLASNARAAAPVEPKPWAFRTPEVMIREMREGYYAVAPQGGEEFADHVFLRVSRPKHGKRKGALVIQTQHSDDYRPFITFWPSGSIYIAQRGDRLDTALMLAAADPFTSAQRYAKIFKVCCRCHKQLTDNRSRWYGIGPECEKHWPEIINEVNETKGVFVPSY